jgi:hypothetical protein
MQRLASAGSEWKGLLYLSQLTDYRKWLKDQRKKRMPPDDTKLEWRKKPVGF